MDELQLHDDAGGDAVDLGKPGFGRGDHVGERAETLDQRLGERFDVAAGNRPEQHQLQQFVVSQRLGADIPEACAKPLPMAMEMRRLGQFRLGFSHAAARSRLAQR